MIIVPFRPEHLERIELQAAQAYARTQFGTQYVLILQNSGPALTVLEGPRVLACGGVALSIGGHAGHLWMLVAREAPMLALHRAVTRFISSLSVKRLEATVRAEFTEGCRWLDLLGFEREGRMRAFDADGSDHWLYARVKP